jgi:hypothetical protein
MSPALNSCPHGHLNDVVKVKRVFMHIKMQKSTPSSFPSSKFTTKLSPKKMQEAR